MVLVNSGGNAYLTSVNFGLPTRLNQLYIPREKCYQKSRPGIEEGSSIFVQWIQDGDGSRFVVDRIHLWRHPQMLSLETHFELVFVHFGPKSKE